MIPEGSVTFTEVDVGFPGLPVFEDDDDEKPFWVVDGLVVSRNSLDETT